MAEQDGVVSTLEDDLVVLKYKDGSLKHYKLGRQFGKVSDIHVPHDIVCDRKVGYKFKAGEVIAFNSGFFKRDFFNTTQVFMMSGVLATTAFLEGNDTLEDSSGISPKISKSLDTTISVTRNIIVPFDKTVHNLVEQGDDVNSDSILCTIEDAVTAGSDIFDAESVNVLNILSSNSPRAKNSGVVDRVEVVYYGDTDALSDGLRKIVKKYDRKRAAEVKRYETDDATTGELGEVILVDGKRIVHNTVVIKILISKKVAMGTGDKAVVANQLKTTAGRVMVGTNETEDGMPVDIVFGYQSVSNRIVLSPEIAGCNGTAMKVISQRFAEIYYGKQ